MNNKIKYIKNVKKLFELSSKDERSYLEDLKNRVMDFSEDFPLADYNDYVEHFGDPKDILILYYEHTDTDMLIRRIKVRKYLILILTIITVFSVFMSILLFRSYLDGKNSYIDREEVIIEES